MLRPSARTLLRTGVLVAAAAAAVLPAAPATADRPDRTTSPPLPVTGVAASCDGFAVEYQDGTTAVFTDTVFSRDGQVLRLVRHASITGSLVAPSSDEALPFRVRRTATTTFDGDQVTTVVTGLSRQVVVPGQGVVALAAGREVLDFSSFPPTTVDTAGRSIAAFESDVCAYFS